MPTIKIELSIAENSSLYANLVAPHNCLVSAQYEGHIDEHYIKKTIEILAKKFPCLTYRLVYDAGRIYFTHTPTIINLNRINIELQATDRIIEKEVNTPFNMWDGPLVRFTVLNNPLCHYLIITISHIISDGVSLAHLIGEFFTVVEKLMQDEIIYSSPTEFFHLDEVLRLEKEVWQNNNIVPIDYYKNHLQQQTNTKWITFSKSINSLKLKAAYGINAKIVAGAGKALSNVIDSPLIKFILPFDLRNLASISSTTLGFYSSWVEFDHVISNKTEGDASIKYNINKAVQKHEPLSNYISLNQIYKTNQCDGIIKNAVTSQSPTICVSNVGFVNIRSNYSKNQIKVKSLHLAANPFFRNDRSFMLATTGFAESVHFSFLYSQNYMEESVAKKIVKKLINCLS